nr:DUF2190 family protein [Sphingomonas sp. Y57]
MNNYVQEGKALNLVAPAGGVVSGRGVLIGALFVVASITAAEGEIFVGRRSGVFDLDAATHATNQAGDAGDPVYWDNTGKKVTRTATGNTIIGVLVEDKVSTVATAKVVLIPRLVAPGAAIPDLAGGADLPTTVTKVNAIIAALEAAGIVVA